MDEQNAQTEQQLNLIQESRSIGSTEHLNVDVSGRGLIADTEASHSAPTFSIFTSEVAPVSPLLSPRGVGQYWCGYLVTTGILYSINMGNFAVDEFLHILYYFHSQIHLQIQASI